MENGKNMYGLLDLLDRRAADGRVRYVRLDSSANLVGELSAYDLRRRSREFGTELSLSCPGTGSPYVLIVARDPLRFLEAFFGILQAGMVPVPAPGMPHAHRGHAQRLSGIIRASAPRAVVVDTPEAAAAPAMPEDCPVLLIDELRASVAEDAPRAGGAPDEVAYVQYTSGSLGAPKPILLRHRQVLAQLAQAAEAFEETTESVSVSWVPLYHDMGLVTAVLRPLWTGYTSVLLDPFDFVRDPTLWPRAMSDWRATHTSAPDFGYALCNRKVPDDTGEYDLTRLRVARSAGEPVRSATMRAFAGKFLKAGFDHAAFTPSYGLAEATLTVTTCPPRQAPRIRTVSAAALRRGQVEAPAGATDAQEVVSCGPPLRGTGVEILDPDTRAVLGPDQVGEVWISGPQVATAPDGAHRVGGTLGCRTGDLGFREGGELFLVGRAKERFQLAGENFYSVELEAVVAAVDDRIRPGRTAVFVAQLPGAPAPVPVVLAECRAEAREETDADTARSLARRIVSALGRGPGLPVSVVWLVPAGTLPVTTSGKIQRGRCRDAFEENSMPTIHRYGQGL
ncbi:AMP-binding protein [Streptomyces poriferorum]|uniref:AMP-binding protein n=1 Tax=Streptomyces poriferorum TaxID=2798799 RepID=UPI0027400587|nr:AMP-binding protein [Streptomyces sp. Alt1]WLQ53129.1 AMP-binding protein [Streptomyces sp. Alt1]